MTALREWFDHTYPRWVDKTNGYKNLKPLRMFVHGLICCPQDELEETLELVRIVEKDLLDHNIITFKVESYEDSNRIDPNTDAGFIQWCIWSLISRIQYKRDE